MLQDGVVNAYQNNARIHHVYTYTYMSHIYTYIHAHDMKYTHPFVYTHIQAHPDDANAAGTLGSFLFNVHHDREVQM